MINRWSVAKARLYQYLSRKEPAVTDTGKPIPRTSGEREFCLHAVQTLYERMLSDGCRMLTSNEFYMAVKSGQAKGTCLVKHDIHQDLERTSAFARMESTLGLQAVYFSMPEHDLTKSYFNTPRMWHVYNEIVAQGHELALHLDLHDLVIRYGGVDEGLGLVLESFEKRGFTIQTANLHGNTLYRKKYGSPKAMLRKLDSDKESLRHVYPISDEKFMKYYASVSLQTLARRYGIVNWIDSEFFRAGERINVSSHCSDNTGAIKLGRMGKNLLTSDPYGLSADFIAKLSDHCKDYSTIFLLHPQYYAPRAIQNGGKLS